MAVEQYIVQEDVATGTWFLHDPDLVVQRSMKITPAYVTNTSAVANTTALIYCDMVLDNQILTLPDATLNENSYFNIKNRGTKSFTIEGAGSDTIDGDLNATIYEKECFTLHADNNQNWNLI